MKIKGGDKLESALADMSAKVKKAASVQIGFMGDATERNGANTAMVAAIQEFGAPKVGIPPRPFFRTMISANSPQWPDQIGTLLKANDYDAAKTLGQMGEEIAVELQDSIIDTSSPPLSPVTLMVRQIIGPNGVATGKDVAEAREKVAAGETASGVSTKPLVWTGAMLNSIRHIVKE